MGLFRGRVLPIRYRCARRYAELAVTAKSGGEDSQHRTAILPRLRLRGVSSWPHATPPPIGGWCVCHPSMESRAEQSVALTDQIRDNGYYYVFRKHDLNRHAPDIMAAFIQTTSHVSTIRCRNHSASCCSEHAPAATSSMTLTASTGSKCNT